MEARRRGWVHGVETVATVALTLLTGVACCGWLVIQWLGLAIAAVAGPGGLAFLVRYEAPLLALAGALSLLAWRMASDPVARGTNLLLGAVALSLALLRVVWDRQPGAVMALPPVYLLFAYRQQVLLVLIGLSLGARVVTLARRAWAGAGRRPAGEPCPVCPWPRRRSAAHER